MSVTAARPGPLFRLALVAVAVGAAALVLHAGNASAQARNPFSVGISEGGGYYTGFAGWLLAKQAEFERLLSTAVRAVRTDRSAMWTLTGLSFAYGVFHAAGPGHGKAVVSSYLLANERALRRGLVISLFAALLQGTVAIVLIGILALVLHATSPVMRDTASLVEKASFAGITVLGLWLVWRKGRAFFSAWASPVRQAASFAAIGLRSAKPANPTGRRVHTADCGHLHMPDPRRLGGDFSWKSAAMTVVAAGVRPCSGAILVLVFALAQGLFLAGVGATFAMSLGTAVTTASLAALAVLAKDVALRADPPGEPARAAGGPRRRIRGGLPGAVFRRRPAASASPPPTFELRRGSKARRPAVGTRIVRRFDMALGMAHEGAGMAENIGSGRPQNGHMAGIFERTHERGVEPLLEREARRRLAPIAAEEKTRRRDGLGEAHAERVAGKDLGLELRLAVAAHRAHRHHASVVESDERRIERVRRPPAGLERVDRLVVEREGRAAVLHEDAGARQDAARAIFPIDRLDIGNREPARVDGAHPHRIALARRRRQGGGAVHANRRRFPRQRRRREKGADVVAQAIEVGADIVADGEGTLGRFDQRVDMREAAVAADAEPLENAEDDERGEALRRRRRVVMQCARRAAAPAVRAGRRDSLARSARVTGAPIRSRSAAISRPTSPR